MSVKPTVVFVTDLRRECIRVDPNWQRDHDYEPQYEFYNRTFYGYSSKMGAYGPNPGYGDGRYGEGFYGNSYLLFKEDA